MLGITTIQAKEGPSLYLETTAQEDLMQFDDAWNDDWLQSDEVVRSRKCKNFCSVNTQSLCACSAKIKNACISENLKVGNLRVTGNIVPRTINVRPGDSINTILNNLADCTENELPIILKFLPGTYDASDWTLTKQLQDITLQGDTNSLAGVAFMEGGMYRFPGLNVQFQIFQNTAIGNGCNYHITLNSNTQVTVTTDNDAGNFCIGNPGPPANNPNFNLLPAGRTVFFVGTDGEISGPFTVASTSGNQITFNENVSGVVGTNLGTTSDPGVGFVICPNVTLTGGPAGPGLPANRVVGIKNLKIRGIFLDWENATNVKTQPGLFLGGVKTKLELSNCMGRGVIRITARESYNCQPNTFIGGSGGSAVIFLPPSEPNFLYNSVFGNDAQVIADTSKAGVFNFAQFSAAWVQVVDLARLSICFSRFFNVRSGPPAVFVTDRARIRWPGGVSYNCDVGARLVNNSAMATTNPNGDAATIAIRNCTLGLDLQQQSQAFMVGVTNPGLFSGNTNDLILDGTLFANINAYVSGTFIDPTMGLISYAITV